MKNRSLTLVCALATLVTASAAQAEIRLRPQAGINWPFGEYRHCFGYSAMSDLESSYIKADQARMAKVGQGAQQQYVANLWSDPILNMQIIVAHELTLIQCQLRKEGKPYSTECPLGSLAREDAMAMVGADEDDYWASDPALLEPLKKEQQQMFDALKPTLQDTCGL
ncbi:hypothetical protein [uncultured Ruegeria sp.]|uniref:hypothetical protein n=1 Tax=uncultured Ruegeria sp. TaxID=259304 RepID=UPI002615A064|nr:hypothetical protein [uncultured Ruegeria sp.]